MNVIVSGLFYLIPGNLELVEYNVYIHEVYDNIKNKRNLVLISGLSSIAFSFLPLRIIRLFVYGLFAYSTYVYFQVIKQHKNHMKQI